MDEVPEPSHVTIYIYIYFFPSSVEFGFSLKIEESAV